MATNYSGKRCGRCGGHRVVHTETGGGSYCDDCDRPDKKKFRDHLSSLTEDAVKNGVSQEDIKDVLEQELEFWDNKTTS